MPATVVSTTLHEPLDWPDATVVSGDAVDVVARIKRESEVPLRSHGSLSMNRALMAAGLVDRVQVTIFPVITGRTGTDPIFQDAADFDLELLERRTLDGHIQELVNRPALHRPVTIELAMYLSGQRVVGVGEVHAGGGDVVQLLAVPRDGVGEVHDIHDFRAAEAGDLHGSHGDQARSSFREAGSGSRGPGTDREDRRHP
jgi:hypothetical protein